MSKESKNNSPKIKIDKKAEETKVEDLVFNIPQTGASESLKLNETKNSSLFFTPRNNNSLFSNDSENSRLDISNLGARLATIDSGIYNTSSFANLALGNNTVFNHGNFLSSPITGSSIEQQIILQEEITKIKKEFGDTLKKLEQNKADHTETVNELQKLQNELKAKEKINHILPRISEEARKQLFDSDDFKNLFANATKCEAVVLSIDVRRSTDLMLKARTPELFAKFITELSQQLSNIIIQNYGVFDKFTGDGILAFFPDFYSGSNAIYYAIKAAKECHESFFKHYNNSRECFNVFIKTAGLGIGIDYGPVTLVNYNNNELTVVGIPVVYASRMSATEAGLTILNQPAKERVENLYPNEIKIFEAEINIKNEGLALAYKIEINEKALDIKKPDWNELIKQYKQTELPNSV